MSNYLSQVISLESKLISHNVLSSPTILAVQALIREICLSPKPGLVDMNNNGAHHDMSFQTFITSINAISNWFERFYNYGKHNANVAAPDFLANIRPIGLECETAMFSATKQINTHKGGIFAFGLLLSAIGKLEQLKLQTTTPMICNEVANICHGMVNKELSQNNCSHSVGERLYKQHNLTGARGEAESGYTTAREISLPIYQEMLNSGYDEESALLQAMLYLLAYNQDTNLVSRGGLAGLEFVQNEARDLIQQGGVMHPNGLEMIAKLDDELIKRHLSPGGSADLIAVTWFLSHYAAQN